MTFRLGLWDKVLRSGARGDGESADDSRVNGAGGGPGFSKPRRDFLRAGVTGAGGAALALALPAGMGSGAGEGRAVRPPGALPERSFLSACIRCGGCMTACPTNALQPAGLIAGLAGFFTPVLVARTGPCEPTCTRCGRVCPTGALRDVPFREKVCAKIGTASIIRRRCIAWERGRECLVCAEVCPFGAIDLRRVPAVAVAVPYVAPNRCNGCGFCEHDCPVDGPSAIFVTPHGALRMEGGSYVSAARDAGLTFEVKQPLAEGAEGAPAQGSRGLPPGFEE